MKLFSRSVWLIVVLLALALAGRMALGGAPVLGAVHVNRGFKGAGNGARDGVRTGQKREERRNGVFARHNGGLMQL